MDYKRKPYSLIATIAALTITPSIYAQQFVKDEIELGVTSRGEQTAQDVYDFRIGPPITPFIGGPTPERVENPLVFFHDRIKLDPTTVILGGMTRERRAALKTYFPGIVQDQWAPPDPTVAVGPNHVVATVNMKIGIYTKDGTLLSLRWLGNQAQDGFFRSVGARDFTFDPRCLYDHISGRYIVIVPEVYGSTEAWLCVGVSRTSDPMGQWNIYRADFRQNVGGSWYWVDYPGLGVDQNAIYVPGNLFRLGGGGFAGAVFRIIPIAPLLSGNPMTFSDIVDTNAASIQAAHALTNANAAFFAEARPTTAMRIHAIRDVLTNPIKSSVSVSVPGYSTPNSSAPQPNGNTIDTLDGRVFNVIWRQGRLVVAHAVRSNSGNRTVGRWYEFLTANYPQSGSVTLNQSGNVDSGSPNYHLFPAVALNDFNDIGMVLGRSSTAQAPAVYVTGRKFTDALGTMGAIQLVKQGASSYNGGRWGDYFGIQVDPSDGLTFWGVGEYADNTGTWSTWITSWKVANYANINVNATSDLVLNLTGVPITCTTDGRGNGNGNTPFQRTYYQGDVVSLEAPARHTNYIFRRWRVNNVDQPLNQRTIQVTLNSNSTATAVYVAFAPGGG